MSTVATHPIASHVQLQHGSDWQGIDLTGWVITEKLDGCRALWDGQQLVTRTGNVIDAPAELLAALPAGVALDGEVYAGRGNYETARQAVQYGRWVPGVRFHVFDAITQGDAAQRRYVAVRAVMAAECPLVTMLPAAVALSTQHAIDTLRHVLDHGGEGLMAQAPGTQYVQGRTALLQKLKAPALEVAEEMGL